MIQLAIADHPLLDAGAFVTTFDRPLGQVDASALRALLVAGSAAPLAADDDVRGAIRDLLRHGGYKPTGRGKPASEYLLRAASDGTLGAINAAVDACNVVSLHSGLPISVVDLDLAREPFSIAVAPAGARYVFNQAGQEIDLEGLVCLFDAAGACANAVKDSQRTKTRPETTRTLSVVWGSRRLGDRTVRAVAWYRELLAGLGGRTEAV